MSAAVSVVWVELMLVQDLHTLLLEPFIKWVSIDFKNIMQHTSNNKSGVVTNINIQPIQ